MIETNWYVITGGPSSGKSTTIKYLAYIGYHVVREAAREIIDEEMKKGKMLEEIRSDESAFQRIVLARKIETEKRIPPEQITFFDRGMPDSIAYYKINGDSLDSVLEASKERKYKNIFFLEQVLFEKDYARTEDEKTAEKISNLLYESYAGLGYSVIMVPKMPVSERVELILKNSFSNKNCFQQ